MKSRRQGVILELVEREALRSQEAVRRRLKSRGFEATQATISRDIKDLGLVKRSRDGAYQRPGADVAASPSTLTALERVTAECLRQVDRAGHLVVVRTGAAQAQPLAIAIDRAQLAEAVGTIAGDDTVLIIAKDDRRAASLAKRLGGYAGR
jgi:transcriptional regulator of arginine metabolism